MVYCGLRATWCLLLIDDVLGGNMRFKLVKSNVDSLLMLLSLEKAWMLAIVICLNTSERFDWQFVHRKICDEVVYDVYCSRTLDKLLLFTLPGDTFICFNRGIVL